MEGPHPTAGATAGPGAAPVGGNGTSPGDPLGAAWLAPSPSLAAALAQLGESPSFLHGTSPFLGTVGLQVPAGHHPPLAPHPSQSSTHLMPTPTLVHGGWPNAGRGATGDDDPAVARLKQRLLQQEQLNQQQALAAMVAPPAAAVESGDDAGGGGAARGWGRKRPAPPPGEPHKRSPEEVLMNLRYSDSPQQGQHPIVPPQRPRGPGVLPEECLLKLAASSPSQQQQQQQAGQGGGSGGLPYLLQKRGSSEGSGGGGLRPPVRLKGATLQKGLKTQNTLLSLIKSDHEKAAAARGQPAAGATGDAELDKATLARPSPSLLPAAGADGGGLGGGRSSTSSISSLLQAPKSQPLPQPQAAPASAPGGGGWPAAARGAAPIQQQQQPFNTAGYPQHQQPQHQQQHQPPQHLVVAGGSSSSGGGAGLPPGTITLAGPFPVGAPGARPPSHARQEPPQPQQQQAGGAHFYLPGQITLVSDGAGGGYKLLQPFGVYQPPHQQLQPQQQQQQQQQPPMMAVYGAAPVAHQLIPAAAVPAPEDGAEEALLLQTHQQQLQRLQEQQRQQLLQLQLAKQQQLLSQQQMHLSAAAPYPYPPTTTTSAALPTSAPTLLVAASTTSSISSSSSAVAEQPSRAIWSPIVMRDSAPDPRMATKALAAAPAGIKSEKPAAPTKISPPLGTKTGCGEGVRTDTRVRISVLEKEVKAAVEAGRRLRILNDTLKELVAAKAKNDEVEEEKLVGQLRLQNGSIRGLLGRLRRLDQGDPTAVLTLTDEVLTVLNLPTPTLPPNVVEVAALPGMGAAAAAALA